MTAKEERMLANAVRQVIVAAEGGSPAYADARSDDDTLEDFKALHAKLSAR